MASIRRYDYRFCSVCYSLLPVSQPRPLIIINHTAAKAKRTWPIVRARLKASGVEFDSYETTHAGAATTRTRTALNDGCQIIVVVGGDGTLSETAEGFFELDQDNHELKPNAINPEAALAVIPAGTGDDFARGILRQRGSVDRWLESLINYCQSRGSHGFRQIDVLDGWCQDNNRRFICLNASTMGIGGETGARVASQGRFMRGFSGEVRFMVAAVGALMAWRERPVRISIDDKQIIEAPMNLVAVANGLYAGGGMMLSPDAKVDDGKLDVVTVSGLSRLGIVRELPRIRTGGHVANPKVKVMQGEKVRIETFTEADGLLIEADGNVRGRTPAEFKVLPSALRFVY